MGRLVEMGSFDLMRRGHEAGKIPHKIPTSSRSPHILTHFHIFSQQPETVSCSLFCISGELLSTLLPTLTILTKEFSDRVMNDVSGEYVLSCFPNGVLRMICDGVADRCFVAVDFLPCFLPSWRWLYCFQCY